MSQRLTTIRSALAALVAAVALYACAGDSLTGPDHSEAPTAREIEADPAPSLQPESDNAPERICGEATVTELVAGRGKAAGDVTVTNNEDGVSVVYRTEDDWELVETHLSVTPDAESIPTTPSGNPRPGRFGNSREHDSGSKATRYDLSLGDLEAEEGDELVIAAHADVLDRGDPADPDDDRAEGAWADGTPFNPTRRGSWATYFEVEVEGCEEVSQVVGPEGGTVVAEDVTVEVPEGALDQEVRITVEPVPLGDLDLDVEGRDAVVEGTVVDLGPDGQNFDEPVEVTIGYDESSLSEGFDESDLRIAIITDDLELLDSSVDTDANEVIASTTHFTFFGVVEPLLLPIDLVIEEAITVTDEVMTLGSEELAVGEVVTVSDEVIVELGPAPIDLTVRETVSVSDVVGIDLGSSNTPPSAEITSPADGATFTEGTSILFEGSASDPEDGALTGSSLVWSSDLDGQIGTGTSFTISNLSVGAHTVTLTATDSDGASATASVVFTVTDSGKWVSISAGDSYTCGLLDNSEAYCWGTGAEGQLGDGGTGSESGPELVVGGLSFTSIDAGERHTCGTTVAEEAWCWGEDGGSGALGDDSFSNSEVPVKVEGSVPFSLVRAGGDHSCGIASDLSVYCWGSNNSGQLGDGSLTDRGTPVLVEGDLAAQQLGIGTGSTTCIVTQTNEAYCWGAGEDGQLGNNFPADRASPQPVSGGLDFEKVAPGVFHTCGITTSEEAWCWGDNLRGRLGDGTTIDREGPVQVASSVSFSDISAGRGHSCGVSVDGDVWCWGDNRGGQLGDGTTTSRTEPVKVLKEQDILFSTVSAGATHTCALTADGAAYCWGTASSLGDSDNFNEKTTFSTTPVRVLTP